MIAPLRVLLAVVLAGAALAWTPVAASADGSGKGSRQGVGQPARASETVTEIFTGTRAGTPIEDGSRTRYTIEVEQVFGESTITTERVQVFTTQAFAQCGQPDAAEGPNAGPSDEPTDGPTTAPTPPLDGATDAPPAAETRYVFRVSRVDDELVASECQSIRVATDATIKDLENTHGPGREPGTSTPPVDEFADVGYTCPETREVVTDVNDKASCAALQDSQPFNRAAAPGLALILIGLLGLVVVRRVGRPKP